MFGIKEYNYSKRVGWFLSMLFSLAIILSIAVTVSAWQGCGYFFAGIGVALIPFLVPEIAAEVIMYNLPMEVGFKRKTQRFSVLITLSSAFVCNSLWYCNCISGLIFGLLIVPVCTVVLPIVLWILVRIISDGDKNRNAPKPVKPDNRSDEERRRDLQELLALRA